MMLLLGGDQVWISISYFRAASTLPILPSIIKWAETKEGEGPRKPLSSSCYKKGFRPFQSKEHASVEDGWSAFPALFPSFMPYYSIRVTFSHSCE